MSEQKMIEWISFDVYSALFDFRASLWPRLQTVLTDVDATSCERLLELWRNRQLALAQYHFMLQRGHLSFRRATALALDYALAVFAIELSRSQKTALIYAWDELEPWPEAPAALEALRQQGYRLALLSNGDQDMLETLAARLPAIEKVASAERAGAYKPHPRIYEYALGTLDVGRSALLHVAGSSTDVMGARSAGLYCAWSNRIADRLLDPQFEPVLTVADLSGLPQALPLLSSTEKRP